MLQVNQLTGFGVGSGSVAASVVFTDSVGTATDASPTVTHSARAIGAAASNRLVVVGVGGRAASGAISSLTIGGVSAAAVAQLLTGADVIEMWAAVVPTGTTADIAITFADTTERHGIGVWALYDLASPTVTDTATATGDPSSTTAVDIPAGGVAVAMAFTASTSGATTWTGLTENFDAQCGGETGWITGACGAFATAQAGPTISADFNPAGTDPGMVVAAWR